MRCTLYALMDKFLSTPSARRATDGESLDITYEAFLSTPSARRATVTGMVSEAQIHISIHALREEGDSGSLPVHPAICYFYPRPPRGGRHADFSTTANYYTISIHALREEGDTVISWFELDIKISIHALREEGDPPAHWAGGLLLYISIHALREEGDMQAAAAISQVVEISIHALREEGDLFLLVHFCEGGRFLSTPSARRATHGCGHCDPDRPISIHALREEGD